MVISLFLLAVQPFEHVLLELDCLGCCLFGSFTLVAVKLDVIAEVNTALRRSLGHRESNHLGNMADHYDVDYIFPYFFTSPLKGLL